MSIHPPRARSLTAPASTAVQRWSFCAVISLGLLMVGLDNSILYTALPQLSQQLHTTDTQQLWIINAYALVLSGLLLGTGTLGDRTGHRRMFLIGLAIFGGASLLAAYSPSAWTLVLSRAFLGCGAAIMMPSSLALIRLTFPDEVERNTAIGIWGSVAVIGAAAGPTVGGFFLEHFWWGSVFLLNVPVVALALALTLLLAPPNAPNPLKHWDFPSSLYSLITLTSLVLAIKSLPHAWPVSVAAAAVFVCGALAFAHRQTRLSDPLLTFDIFGSRVFSGGALAAGGAMFGMSGLELLSTQKLQLVDALSPLHAGLIISAMALSAIPTSILGGATLHRLGFLPLISGGFLLMATGMTLLLATRGETLALLVVTLVLTGLGAGLAMSVSSTAIINAAPLHRTGMAAGVEAVSYEFGTLISIALTGTLVPLLMARELPPHLAELGTDALHHPASHATAASAYNAGYLSTIGGLACFALLLAAITAWCFRDNPKSGDPHAANQQKDRSP